VCETESRPPETKDHECSAEPAVNEQHHSAPPTCSTDDQPESDEEQQVAADGVQACHQLPGASLHDRKRLSGPKIEH